MNVTIRVRPRPERSSKNEHTFLYLFYPETNATVHRIQTVGHDPSVWTYRILTTTSSFYTLMASNQSIDVVLLQSIVHDREDRLIIRMWDPHTPSASPTIDTHLHFIYRRSHLEFPAILPHRIDGYVNHDDTYSIINLGRLFVTDQARYPLVHFHLPTHDYFFLKPISKNLTALHMTSVSQQSSLKYRLNLTAVAIHESIIELNSLHRATVILPSMIETHTLDVDLLPVDRSMLEQTILLIFHVQPELSHEQFIRNNLPMVQERIADLLGVQPEDALLYSFEFKRNSMELLLAVTNHSSTVTRRFIGKDRIYSMLQESTDVFDEILLDLCQSSTCNHHGRCQSSLELLTNRYDYFSYHRHRRLLPKHQWNTVCSCERGHYGSHCQFEHAIVSPCTSTECSTMPTTFECINRNSPTCRGRLSSSMRMKTSSPFSV